MSEYIEREAVMEHAEYTQNYNLVVPVRFIKAIPASDAQPVRHAHWIEDGGVQICSECGEEHEWEDFRANYCDNCGAKMDGGTDDENNV